MTGEFTVRYISDHDIHEFTVTVPDSDLRYAFAETMANLYMRDLTQVFWSVWQGEHFVAAFNRHGFTMTRTRWQQVADSVTNPNLEVRHG